MTDLMRQKDKSASADKSSSMPVVLDGEKCGVPVIESYVKALPSSPGVYRMMNLKGDILYVGKAKNLKKRVVAYTSPERQSYRIQRMISQTVSMEFVTTQTEAEALLLESNLIKRYKPKYNILLRDDKSFPFILVTSDHDFPQILKHRGAQNKKGDYFGPFASVWAVNETLAVLQRAFLLRTCTDSIFANRTRPCLLHQIKRCAAPCVNKVSSEDYQELVYQAHNFLSGGSNSIQKEFSKKMQQASDVLEFEVAAQYRDRIQALTRVQARQDINMQSVGEADVIAAYQGAGVTCIQVFFFRAGANYGNRSYFPSQARDAELAEVIEAFIAQFYAKTIPPKTIFTSHKVPNTELLSEALSVRSGRSVKLVSPIRGDKRKIIEHAVNNAKEAHGRKMVESASQQRLLEQVQGVFKLGSTPTRIEVYDNSHISGAKAVGGMIVVGAEGLVKNAYRKFTIKGAAPTESYAGEKGYAAGDDYAMMKEVLTRRFSRALLEDPDKTSGQWPDLVLLDGGKGQLSMGLQVFEELGIDDIAIAGIAKGPDRNAGRERIFLSDGSPAIELDVRDPALYFLQRLRDEAHRFAIGSHRHKRSKAISRSILDEIPSVGAKRKKALLHHFGGPDGVAQAGRSDLEATEGINKALANKIYDWFHPDG
jgi:excinuclease ABC subunit C